MKGVYALLSTSIFMSQIEVINRVFEDKLNHTELKGFIIVMTWMINSIIEICKIDKVEERKGQEGVSGKKTLTECMFNPTLIVFK